MLKSDLLNRMADAFPDLRRPEVDRAVDAVLATIQTGVKTGRRVELRGFGVFTPTILTRRRARNPKTGAGVLVPERLSVRFHAGKAVHRRLNPSDVDSDA